VKQGQIASLSLRLVGWEVETELPDERKYVCLAFPHTSNWDGLMLISLAQSLGLTINWMIKDDWVKGPLGVLLRRLGAVAVNRGGAHNLVDQMIEAFRSHDELALVIPPEGTRGRAEHWRSGFYHIARGADVPVVPGYLDYGRKRAGFGPARRMTGDMRADMDDLRAYYAGIQPQGRVRSNVGPIRLREENPAA
jgi:1-acyl-sn-glycerol-3-phosphate acyltransferase